MDRIDPVQAAAAKGASGVAGGGWSAPADADGRPTQSMAGLHLTRAAGRRAMRNARSVAAAPAPVGCKAATSSQGGASA